MIDAQSIARLNEEIKSRGFDWEAEENDITRLSDEQRRNLLGAPLPPEEAEELDKLSKKNLEDYLQLREELRLIVD
jgi:hypothetical protein